MSKRDCCEIQDTWNATIDRYIALGQDKRPREEIERAAKIGTSNGALYRKCEGEGCDKIEGKTMRKPLFCSACKMVCLDIICVEESNERGSSLPS